MEIVIGRQIPQHWLALNKDVITEEQVIRFLSLFVKEGVVIIALETLHHVSRMACPLVNLPICFHSVHQVRTAILYGNGIAMVMVPKITVRSILRLCFGRDSAYMCVKRFTASVS